IVNEPQSGAYTYRLTSYDSSGEVTEEFFFALFSPHPDIDLGPDLSLCGNDSIILDATPIPSDSENFGQFYYTWFQGSAIIPDEEGATLNVHSPGTYIVEVSGSILNEAGHEIDPLLVCTSRDTIQISGSDFTVNLGDDKTLCDVGTTQLTANIDDANPGNASFQWSGPSGAIPQNTH